MPGSSTTHLVLLEDVPAGFAPEPGDSLVAVTPVAVAKLDELGLVHQVLADLVDEGALAALEDEFWQEQLEWFELLGSLLRERVPDLAEWEVPLPYFYAFFLKTTFDIVFIRGFELRALLEQGCDRVILWTPNSPERPLDETLGFQGPTVLSRLVAPFCESAGVAYEVRALESDGKPHSLPVVEQSAKGRVDGADRIEAAVDKLFAIVASLRRGRKTFVFVNTLYDVSELYARARKAGHRCLLMQGSSLVDVSGLRARPVFDLSVTPDVWTQLADELTADGSPVWSWPSSWFGISVADLIAPRLRYFLAEVAPLLFAETNKLQEAFDLLNVDFVSNPYVVHIREGAVGAAARLSRRTRSVVIEHGDMVFTAKEADLGYLLCSDHFFAGNAEVADYFEGRRGSYMRQTAEVHVGSYRWPALAKRSPPRRETAPPLALSGRPVAVYVITALAGDSRYLNSAWYSDAWYYRLQTRIVDALAARTDYDIVVKDFPGGSLQVEDPIAAYARSLGLEHVSVSDAPFREWLPFTTRAIIDFPSSAVYECALAGVPFVGLVYEHFKVRETALAQFGPSLVRFATADDAVATIDRFLSTPTWHEPALDVDDSDILELLERL